MNGEHNSDPLQLPPHNITLRHSLRHYFGDVLRYLYFMRFSLLLWLSMVALTLMDWLSPGIASITRGILTPFNNWQWFFSGFAIVLPGWYALLAARIVCAYGTNRFDAQPPPVFDVPPTMQWFVFWGAQLPGIGLLVRIAYNSVHEGEGSYSEVYFFLATGAVAAVAFWYLVAILYYWTYDPDSAIPARAFLVPKWSFLPLDKIEKLTPDSSLKLFHWFLGLLCNLGPGYTSTMKVKVNDTTKHRPRVSPGHVVAALALACAVILYALLMPISAPIPVPRLATAGRVASLLIATYVFWEFLRPSLRILLPKEPRPKALPNEGPPATEAQQKEIAKSKRRLPEFATLVMIVLVIVAALKVIFPLAVPDFLYVFILFTIVVFAHLLWERLEPTKRAAFGRESLEDPAASKDFAGKEGRLPALASLVMFVLLLILSAEISSPRAVPVIAYVVILLMVVFWSLAGIAFLADRFRVPVLTVTIVVILGFNRWPAEHVFSAEPIATNVTTEPIQNPADFVNRIAFSDPKGPQPVIIVTATGGGIHAAAWTATVLREVDKQFGGLQFHNHILLMSGVSGGSVATAAFLREYFSGQDFNSASYDRIQGVAGCSSLQAVAWGLAYPDTLRLLFPWVFNALSSLDRFDRGWALEKALDRNLHDPICIKNEESREADGGDLATLTLNTLARLDNTKAPCKDHLDSCRHFPAFTLNTTVVETGDRFLLSNYSVFAGNEGIGHVLPAASFLGTYARESILPLMPHPNSPPSAPGARLPTIPVPSRGQFADLSLLTAARLSASFTYVSPATRIPFENSQGKEHNAYHFVDGGYYDNDGTNSAIEFLQAASAAFWPAKPLRVLLIEIRNTDDININDSPDSYGFQAGLKWNGTAWSPEAVSKKRFGPVNQLAAPPEAALYAGFSSVTRRNRRELDTLKNALCGSLDLKHVILDYQQKIKPYQSATVIDEGESELDQPLSWHLTKRQQDWIEAGKDKDPEDALDRKTPISDRANITKAVEWFREAQKQAHSPIAVSDACKAQYPQNVVSLPVPLRKPGHASSSAP